MSDCINYKDKDALYEEAFACYNDSLQDLPFTHYDLDLKDENIVSIFNSMEPSELIFYKQSKNSFQIVFSNRPLFIHFPSNCRFVFL